MNLFRSEEHVRNWSLYARESVDGILSLRDYAALFGRGLFRERLSPDYLLRAPQLLAETMGEWMAALEKLGKAGAFWQPG